MGIGGIGASSFCVMRDQVQGFKSGKQNIQKEDLEKIQCEIGAGQSQIGDMFTRMLESFDEIDTNGDGISIDKLKSFTGQNEVHNPKESGIKLFSLFQDDESSGVTKEELQDLTASMESSGMNIPGKLQHIIASFDSFDTNSDGTLSKSEMKDGMHAEKHDKMRPPRPPKGASKEELEGLASEIENLGIEIPDKLSSMIESFDSFDTDGDGLLTKQEIETSMNGGTEIQAKTIGVTKEELESIASKIGSTGIEIPNQLSSMIESFDSLDTNKDGQVTHQEMMAALKEAKENIGVENEDSDFLKQFNESSHERKTRIAENFFNEKINAYSMFSQKSTSANTQ